MSYPETTSAIDPLTRLAIRHGTDKWGPHFYTPIYNALFAHLRERSLRLLEIGVGGYAFRTAGGASLSMWAEYFPHGEITGIDIVEKRLHLDPRIKLFQGSQEDAVFLKKISDERGPFNIIIDDGSHLPKHMVASFKILFPLLADDGIYIIEDVQTAFWPHLGGSALHGGEVLKLVRSIVEYLHHAEIAVVDRSHVPPLIATQVKALRVFHNLIVIDKGDNGEPSNHAYNPNNPHAARAIAIIEEELEKEPTPEGTANLIEIYCRSGNPTKATALADEALAKWPDNPMVAMAAFNIAPLTKTPMRIDYIERFLRLEPDNVTLLQALVKARGSVKT